MVEKRRPQHFFPGEELDADEMRVTLLGTGTPFPRRGQASASVFVEAGEHKFFLDIGPGAPANATSLEVPMALLDRVYVTHHHVDHIGGLDELWIGGWTYGRPGPMQVWGPPGTNEIVKHLRAAYRWDIESRSHAFPAEGAQLISHEYAEGVIHEIDDLRISAFPVEHVTPHNSYGIRVDYRDRSLVYSGDTKRSQSLIDHSQQVDVLIHESFPPADLYAQKSGRPLELARKIAEVYHTSPRELGTVLRDMQPGLGVIYHMYNDADLIGPAVDQVRESFAGPLIVGHDLQVINVGDEIVVREAIVSDKPWPALPAEPRR